MSVANSALTHCRKFAVEQFSLLSIVLQTVPAMLFTREFLNGSKSGQSPAGEVG
jgi:hypothetical protein